ncbi:PIG-L family deacetylase [Mucilaginibacter sp. UR6-1]|uniref:PIG-L family deacetylase n=1 Tax=Mucilaginibacter sp. UR6-1 TaxID=1435643 RepID=UPI001E296E1A|nr:PIG-L family deacetylase [Mucilaginibacter sp. UR6-1]MCC8409494.1 PIG-L family deacetylase [Mucilaginibacter sp. UR6-1]
MKRILLSASLLLLSIYSYSQSAPAADVASIEQNLQGLNTLGSVLYVAAHPDDENTRLLAWLAREKHYRTGYLSLTRGDGGQNLIGTEQSELLGLVRTQELLAARRYDGAEQFFTRANDFGFSKTPEETLKIWDKEKVLGDVVWVIRKFRPDVMICRFPTTGEGGHGHHTSSAILAQEAFAAAADPKRFPEQLKYVQVWQAKRLLWNTFNFGNTNTINPNQFKVDVGGYNVFMGKSYGEIAAQSRSNHKSQGFGAAAQRGEWFEYFKTIAGEAPKKTLLDGVDTTWARTKAPAEISAAIVNIQKSFSPSHPELSVNALVDLLGKIEATGDVYWRTQKVKQVKDLIAGCAGLWFESYATEPTYAVGDSMGVMNQFIIRNPVQVTSVAIDNGRMRSVVAGIRTPNVPTHEFRTVAFDAVKNRIPFKNTSQPYWLGSAHGIGLYTLPADTLAGYPENPNTPSVSFEFTINNKKIRYEAPVVYKYTDPVRGEVYQPVEIVPPVTANVENPVYLFSGQQPQQVRIKLKNFTPDGEGYVSIKPVNGWTISPEKIDFADKKINDEWTVSFTVTPTGADPLVSKLQAVVNTVGKDWSLGLHRIKYEHIPNITLFPPAEARLVNLDIKTAGKNIAYLPGAGDKIPEALRQLGYNVHILSEDDIMNTDLAIYDAIITGVRSFNVNPRLVFEQPRLLNYVNNGGNLVVQYNTAGRMVTDSIGPYPFEVVNQRVTEEDAKVTFSDPASPLLNYPNKITNADFDGWIQERGLYFAASIDKRYSTPLQMNDTKMPPNKGSLITADYGKGRFVYTSLSFFRELPAGVPGAYRLFINLLSKPQPPVQQP